MRRIRDDPVMVSCDHRTIKSPLRGVKRLRDDSREIIAQRSTANAQRFVDDVVRSTVLNRTRFASHPMRSDRREMFSVEIFARRTLSAKKPST